MNYRLLKSLCRYYSPKSGLDELIFFVTYRCNFKCKTCFYVSDMNKSAMGQVNELSLDEIRKVSSSLPEFSKLLVSGGEPFLRDDLPEICEIFYQQNKINLIHLPTNGFYREKICFGVSKILEKCPKLELIVSLPLDGFEATHDKIKGVEGSFKKVIETIESLAVLKKKFTNLRINMISVVNNLNLGEIIDLAEFIKTNLPVDSHGPSPVRGAPHDKELSGPTYKQWEDLSKELLPFYNYWNKRRMTNKLVSFLVTNKVRYLYKIYTGVLKGEKLPFKCQAGGIIAVLEANGDVRICELTEPVGNIRDSNYDFPKVLKSQTANEMKKKIRDCACTHACFMETSIKMNPLTLLKSYLGG